jgi:hypothetical protein
MNRMNRRWRSGFLCLWVALGWVTSALAPVLSEAAPSSSASRRIGRNTCFTRGSAGERGRQMGMRNGTRLVSMVWTRMGQSCDQVDRLAQIIAETPLARPTTGGEFAACFYQGYIDALWGQIDQVYNRCGNLCFNAGAEIGHISAQGYCAASLAIDGLLDPGFISQPPLPFCGENLVLGCKSEYIYVASYEYPGCRAFTQREYASTFDNFVRQDCFVPEDVPIRDSLDFLL